MDALRYYYKQGISRQQMENAERARKMLTGDARRVYDSLTGRERSLMSYFVRPDGTYRSLDELNLTAIVRKT